MRMPATDTGSAASTYTGSNSRAGYDEPGLTLQQAVKAVHDALPFLRPEVFTYTIIDSTPSRRTGDISVGSSRLISIRLHTVRHRATFNFFQHSDRAPGTTAL